MTAKMTQKTGKTKASASGDGRLSQLGRSLFRRVGSAGKTALAVVGLGTVISLAVEYRTEREMEEKEGTAEPRDEGSKQARDKCALVLPFHRMKVVEKKRGARLDGRLNILSKSGEGSEDRQIEIELGELVDIIHAAAADPTVVSLYATFGKGHRFSAGGYAHIDEIRNAIRVFNESHRSHLEPNVGHDPDWPAARKNGRARKTSYAFADTFAHPLDTGNKEFYLASAFTHVHLQSRGALRLLGLSTSTMFLRDALDKYGIKVHVFKHGKYKNAPNAVTEKRFTKEHLANTKTIIKSLNNHLCTEIARSRSLPHSFDEPMWQAINNHGTLTPLNAHEVGLIDYMPRIDPLDSLLNANKNDKALMEMKEKWSNETDFNKFTATNKISLQEYSALLAKQKKATEKKRKRREMLKHLSEKNTGAELLLKAFGYSAPNYNIDTAEFSRGDGKNSTKEKVAVVTVAGLIDDKAAAKVIGSLRKIKEDKNTKCVVLRVDSPGGSVTASEAILEECKDLSKPVVCSMANYAASGGYYVASHCKHIFALPNTVTGSIGVFGAKLDLTGMASQYGVNVEHVSIGKLSSANDPFQPLTGPMRGNFRRDIDRFYDYFKEIVSSGRSLTLDEVEAIAQGRVWTGEQAQQIGLVDELGGINRAISYAKQQFTSGEAEVESWPKRPTLNELLRNLTRGNWKVAIELLTGGWNELLGSFSGNEKLNSQDSVSGVICMPLEGGLKRLPCNCVLPPSLFTCGAFGSSQGMMLTMNETDAIRLAMASVSDCSIPPASTFLGVNLALGVGV